MNLAALVGKQTTGKSTLAHHLARMSGKPEAIFDPCRQFDPRAIGGSLSFGQAEFEDALERGKFPAILQRPHGLALTDASELFEDFIEPLLELRGLAIVIDEGRLISRGNFVAPALSALLLEFGHSEFSIYFTVHRPTHVHPDVRAAADHLIFFRTKLVEQLEWISANCSPEASEAVRGLAGRQYLDWRGDQEDFVIQGDSASWHEKISGDFEREKVAA